MKKRTIEALKEGKDCVYNATNLSAKKRIAFLKELERFPDVRKVAVLNVVPPAVVFQRNASRERHVPESVIIRMLKSFEVPHYSEGWNEIIVYNQFYQPSILSNIVITLRAESHDNPHHSQTIGKHMGEAAVYLMKKGTPDYLISAAYFHDAGKSICKTFTNMKGEPTTIAHYYFHENVGAYLYLTYCYHSSIDLYIANLIAHHMDFFKGEKYLQKIEDRFGEDFMRDLRLLHEADLAAH